MIDEAIQAGSRIAEALGGLIDAYETLDTVDMVRVLELANAYTFTIRTLAADNPILNSLAYEVAAKLDEAVTKHRLLEPGSPQDPDDDT